MHRKSLAKLALVCCTAAASAAVVALKVALSQAGPPPPPRPPRPPPPRRPGPGPRPPAKPPKRAVLPRRRPLRVHRVGPNLVIRHGATVIRPAPRPLVVRRVTDLRPVPVLPAETIRQATAYKVVRIDEGHTPVLLMDGKATPVRMLGVDPAAPEGAKPSLTEQVDRFYRNLLVGEWVYLEGDDSVAETDESGTRVAYLHRAPSGLPVNLEAIRQGYALAAAGYDYKHKALFEFYESKARADDKGIWADMTAAVQGDSKSE